MPAAEVHPLNFRQYIAEFFCHSIQRHRQRVGVLLAQGVEMQPVQKLGQGGVLRHGGVPRGAGRAKAAAGGAGVVDGVTVLRGAFGVDAQPHAFARRLDLGAEFCQLRGRVEHDMVGVAQQLVHLVVAVGGAENVYLAAGHLLGAKAGFVQTAGLGAGKVRRQQRIQVVVAERLLRQQNFAARALRQCAQQFGIAAQRPFVQQVAGCGQGVQRGGQNAAQRRKRRAGIRRGHQSTSAGAKFSLRGRPYLSSASRNGSGLNSSTV